MVEKYRIRNQVTNELNEIEYHQLSARLMRIRRFALNFDSKFVKDEILSLEEINEVSTSPLISMVHDIGFLLGVIESISIENQRFQMNILDDFASLQSTVSEISEDVKSMKKTTDSAFKNITGAIENANEKLDSCVFEVRDFKFKRNH